LRERPSLRGNAKIRPSFQSNQNHEIPARNPQTSGGKYLPQNRAFLPPAIEWQSPAISRTISAEAADFFALGYLRRAPLVDYEAHSHFLQYEFIYWLSRSGLNLARKLGLDNGFARATGEKSPHSLVHEDEITSFHLELKKLPYQLSWRQRDLKRTVNPDALFGLTDPSKPAGLNTHWYFLEIEKSRQGHYRTGESALLKRVDAYFRYFNSNKCESEWKRFRKFRVIFVRFIRGPELPSALWPRKRKLESGPFGVFHFYGRIVGDRAWKIFSEIILRLTNTELQRIRSKSAPMKF
jgi:hypothetical protein